MIKLILSAPVPAMARAFDSAFSAIPDVTVHHGPFETLGAFDCMVSAANSFGLMDGGVDAAITAFFGTQLQARVQQHIIREYLGEQPVGTAFVIESGNSNHPWLVHAPTMRVPQTIDGTDTVYSATRAALLAIHHHNLNASDDQRIRTVVFPAMGAGCGRVPPISVAAQMKLAWLNFISPAQGISWQYATQRHQAVVKAFGCTAATDWHPDMWPLRGRGCDCGCGWGSMAAGTYGATSDSGRGHHSGEYTHSIKSPECRCGRHNHYIHTGAHTHSILPSLPGCHDHRDFISTIAHHHGVKK
ncbi:macro domain-containing protein [Izhakiella australiensis]|uniref:macro domain-containing protein n=1 Tax=Izhakiella australiensis TaxID=1926881 RepID=UPI00098EF13C|nr:macro domain-containing protein [Izhakiella australiensis]